jgi:hypothetical protein
VSETVAALIWLGLAGYLAAGLLVALGLFAGGLRRIDPLAASAPFRVKLLLVPGLCALWPIMLSKAIASAGKSDP